MVNRVLTPYLYEAMLAAQEGTPLAVIDACAVDFGMPVGPIELVDVVGLERGREVGFHDFVAKFDRTGLIAAIKEQGIDIERAA